MELNVMINVIEQILMIGCGVFSGLFFCRVLCLLAIRKEGRFFHVLVYLSSVFLSGMTIFPNDRFNVTLALIWLLLLLLLCFKGDLVARLSVVMILFPMIIAENFLAVELLGYFYYQTGRLFVVDVATSLLVSGSCILFWYLINRLVKARVGQASRLFDRRAWLLLGAICLASLVSIMTFIYFAPQESWKVWPGALACLMTNIGSLYLAGYFVNSIKVQADRKNLQLQQNYYEELEKNQQEVRKLRHDMKNHLSVIRNLMETGEKTDAAVYLESLEKEVSVRNRLFCKNGIINAVLNTKYQQAADAKASCFFHISLPEELFIDPISLCTIFANTIDNAIEASVKLPEEQRRISVKARIEQDSFFYEIENQKNNLVFEKNGKFLSDKDDIKEHGMGISNVREIVEKYDGMMDVFYTDELFRVVILIREQSH